MRICHHAHAALDSTLSRVSLQGCVNAPGGMTPGMAPVGACCADVFAVSSTLALPRAKMGYAMGHQGLMCFTDGQSNSTRLRT